MHGGFRHVAADVAFSLTAISIIGGAAPSITPPPPDDIVPERIVGTLYHTVGNRTEGALYHAALLGECLPGDVVLANNLFDTFGPVLREAVDHLKDEIRDKAEEAAVTATLTDVGEIIWHALLKRKPGLDAAGGKNKALATLCEIGKKPPQEDPTHLLVRLGIFSLLGEISRPDQADAESADLSQIASIVDVSATERPSGATVLTPGLDKEHSTELGRHVVMEIVEKVRAVLCGEHGLVNIAKEASAQDIAEKIREATFQNGCSAVAAHVIAGSAVYVTVHGLSRFCDSSGQRQPG